MPMRLICPKCNSRKEFLARSYVWGLLSECSRIVLLPPTITRDIDEDTLLRCYQCKHEAPLARFRPDDTAETQAEAEARLNAAENSC